MIDIDPDFALQSRLSFGRGARYGWALTAVALFLAFDGFASSTPPEVAMVRAGLFLLLGALPYGAIQVRALERQGHLDARRLTGRSPFALGLTLISGSAWALLLSGVVLLLAGAATGQRLPAFTLAALLALGIAMALVLLLMPASPHVDSWMLLVLLVAGVYSSVEAMRSDRGVALGVMVVSAVIFPWALPMALRRMRGAVAIPAGPPVSVMRLVMRQGRAAHPELARGLFSAGQSFSVAPVMALAGIWWIWWLTRNLDAERRDIFIVFAVYGPLVLAGYDTAARVHREHEIGGLERIRLSGQSSWRVVVEMAFALSLPFVAVSIVCAGALAVIDPRYAAGILRPWPIAAGILTFWPLVSAFRGRKPGLFIVVSAFMAFVLARAGTPWALGALAVATGIAAATLSLGRAGGMAADTRMVVAGAASIAAIVAAVAGPDWNGLAVAAVLSLGVGLLVPDGTRVPGRAIVAGAAAAAVAVGLAEYFWAGGHLALNATSQRVRYETVYFAYTGPGSRVEYAAMAGLYAAFGLAFGCFAWNRLLERPLASLALRATPFTVAVPLLLALDTRIVFFANQNFMRDYGYNGVAVLELVLLVLLAASAAVLAWQNGASIKARTLRS